MENNMTCSSWTPDNAQQSQWLKATLSDLENKTKAVMTLLGEDNSFSVHMAEDYHKRRSESIQLLEEITCSYHSLAEKYEHLRSKPDILLHSVSDDPRWEIFNSELESVVEHPDTDCSVASFEYLNKLADDLMSTEPGNMNGRIKPDIRGNQIVGHNTTGEFLRNNGWEDTQSVLKFEITKLMVENLRHQAELLKRNDEKRAAIKELRLQLERLKDENRILRSCLRCSNVGTKCKKFFSGNLFKGGCL